jgi:raffinose/stachyose/melibiose transport system substrate-binding protein
MSKKAFTALFATSLIFMTACSGSGTNATDSNNEGGDSSNSKESVTIDFMHLWPAGSSAEQQLHGLQHAAPQTAQS